MEKTTAKSPYDSRLVRLLRHLDLSDTGSANSRFAEKFSQLLHFSGAVNLSQVLKTPAATRFTPSDISGAAIRNVFLSGQRDLVRSITKSFLPAATGFKDRLPTAEALHHHCGITGAFPIDRKKKARPHAAVYEPYRLFYISRQRMLDIRVQGLRSDIRSQMAGLSAELARLAQIDHALDKSLAGAPMDIFARIAPLLEDHFNRLLETPWQTLPANPGPADIETWMEPDGCITRFCGDMRELLFAELEIRLQPVAGMVEATLAGSPG